MPRPVLRGRKSGYAPVEMTILFEDRARLKSVPQGAKALVGYTLYGTAEEAAEKFGAGQERRTSGTSGAKARRILNHLRPD
jgi:hypothetical protein